MYLDPHTDVNGIRRYTMQVNYAMVGKVELLSTKSLKARVKGMMESRWRLSLPCRLHLRCKAWEGWLWLFSYTGSNNETWGLCQAIAGYDGLLLITLCTRCRSKPKLQSSTLREPISLTCKTRPHRCLWIV